MRLSHTTRTWLLCSRSGLWLRLVGQVPRIAVLLELGDDVLGDGVTRTTIDIDQRSCCTVRVEGTIARSQMRIALLIVATALVAGSALTKLNYACKSGHYGWCAPTVSAMQHHTKARHG